MDTAIATAFQESNAGFSDTQKKKVCHLFKVLDVDGNGHLEPDDFLLVGRKIIKYMGLEEESRAARLILIKSHRLFVQLMIDVHNTDFTLTVWDWVAFFRSQTVDKTSATLSYYIQRTSRHIFDLFDANGDQMISRSEYANMLTVYGISHEMANQSFKELDLNHDDLISAEELMQGLANFFLSSDSDAKGNLIFGAWR